MHLANLAAPFFHRPFTRPVIHALYSYCGKRRSKGFAQGLGRQLQPYKGVTQQCLSERAEAGNIKKRCTKVGVLQLFLTRRYLLMNLIIFLLRASEFLLYIVVSLSFAATKKSAVHFTWVDSKG